MDWIVYMVTGAGLYFFGYRHGRSDERKRVKGLMYSAFQRTHSSQTLRWVLNAVESGARTLGPKEEFFPPALVGFTEEEPSSVASFESSMDGLQRAVDASSINPDGVRTEMRAVLDELKREHPDYWLLDIERKFRIGERRPTSEDHPLSKASEKEWDQEGWDLQVGNTSSFAWSLDEARAELKERLRRDAEIPVLAARLADVLREIPEGIRFRDDVKRAADLILENEKGRGGS